MMRDTGNMITATPLTNFWPPDSALILMTLKAGLLFPRRIGILPQVPA